MHADLYFYECAFFTAAIDYLLTNPVEKGAVDIQAFEESFDDGLTLATQQAVLEQVTANKSTDHKLTADKSSMSDAPHLQATDNNEGVPTNKTKSSSSRVTETVVQLPVTCNGEPRKRCKPRQTARKSCGGYIKPSMVHLARMKMKENPQLTQKSSGESIPSVSDKTKGCTCSGVCNCSKVPSPELDVSVAIVEKSPAKVKDIEVLTLDSDSN